jgi:hypothetical protein
LFGATSAAGVDHREQAQPDGVELAGQPVQGHDLGGQQRVAELVEVVGGELADRRGQPLQPRRQPTLGARRQPAWPRGRLCGAGPGAA